jgi:predicted translin family RNA/ssDNA-binding protein
LIARFLGIWKYQVQQVVFISSLIEYMRTGTLVKIVEVEATLGLPGKTPQDPCAWAVELEDYLLGVSFLPSELSRMCLNAVIREDYAFPFKAARFVEDLFAGFRLLNLKNDFLRKRFDSIKYEEKKIQEILYDISIRKLNKTAGAAKAE